MKGRFAAGLAVLALICFFGSALDAQLNRASITGTVVDSSGALVADVEVTVTEIATGEVNRARTNNVGIYSILNLTPGKCSLRFAKGGFTPINIPQITLQSTQVAKFDETLPQEAFQAQHERRLGDRKDQPALRHDLHPRADRRSAGAKPKQAKFAVMESLEDPAQHKFTAAAFPSESDAGCCRRDPQKTKAGFPVCSSARPGSARRRPSGVRARRRNRPRRSPDGGCRGRRTAAV